MDFGRILGALVQGAAAPPARRGTPRGRGAFGMTATETRQIGRVLGSLASVAMEAMKAPPAPREPPARREAAPPAKPTGRIRDTAGRIRDTEGRIRDTEGRIRDGGPAPRIPNAGASYPAPSPPAPSPWTPRPGAAPEPPAPRDEPDAEHAEAMLLTQAMIAAARADGVTDAAERAAISRQLDAAGLTGAERDHVLASFDAPMTPEALAREARDPMLRAQLYAACVAAMGQISPPERAWLDRLSAALKLDAAARASIEKRLQP